MYHLDVSGYDGRKVDMWSAGVILYSLLTGNLPFANDIRQCKRFKNYKQWLSTDYLIQQKDKKPIKLPTWFAPSHFTSSVTSLLVKLLHPDPLHRISATDASKHPWCLGNDFCEEYDVNILDPTRASVDSIANLNRDTPESPIDLNLNHNYNAQTGGREVRVLFSSPEIANADIRNPNISPISPTSHNLSMLHSICREEDEDTSSIGSGASNASTSQDTSRLVESGSRDNLTSLSLSGTAPGKATGVSTARRVSRRSRLSQQEAMPAVSTLVRSTSNSALPQSITGNANLDQSPNGNNNPNINSANVQVNNETRRRIRMRPTVSNGSDTTMQERKEQEYLSRLNNLVSAPALPPMSIPRSPDSPQQDSVASDRSVAVARSQQNTEQSNEINISSLENDLESFSFSPNANISESS